MSDKPNIISRQTLLPISLVVVLLGGMGWLTQIYFTATANAVVIEKIMISKEKYNEKVYRELNEINKRLSRIEGKLERK